MRPRIHSLALLATALGIVVSSAALGQGKQKAIADLQKAYIGETTASAKYAAYAKVANQENYKDAAALFRAASAAEKVHAKNHKAALAELGVKNPKAGAYVQKPGTTRANLQDAIKGETYEFTSMYPGMVKDAQAAKADSAARSCNFAMNVEKQHASLYKQALQNLSKRPKPVTYYVCPVCGSTFRQTAPANCPICATPKEQFKKIV